MGRKFISTLGTGKYEECFYKIGNEYVQSRYIQHAIFTGLCRDWTKDDKVIILVTKDAREKNWFNIEDENRRLKNILEKQDVVVEAVDIPDGKSEKELWETFDIIYNCLEEGDEVIFDITHSFRSIPMYVLVVLNYAKVLKNVTLNGIFYGAYEAREKQDGKEVAPVFDLAAFDELLSWTSSVDAFIKYGISQPIYDLFDSIKKKKNKQGDRSYNNLEEIITTLNDFGNDILICAGRHLDKEEMDNRKDKKIRKKSVSAAALFFESRYKELKEEGRMHIKPLQPLFLKLEEKIQPFETEDNLKVGLATIEWSIRNNLIQQGYTALDETIKTYVCKLLDLDERKYINREKLAAPALRIKAKDIPEDKWQVEPERKADVREIINILDARIAKISDKVSSKRNVINHFGFPKSEKPIDYVSLKDDLTEYYKEFKDILLEAGNEI